MAFLCLLFLELLALLSARYPSFPARFSSSDIVSHIGTITRVQHTVIIPEPRPLSASHAPRLRLQATPLPTF